eukprot:TRINITY_DN1830_c0_g1_i2.p1 TRINITY_DN1830_c0_g1~~TRINITY_DN1830_c0_g1_i2.p1  ORF type:complete len:329 (-),score=113.34 TRINITY_DN1830_c0_g1_i2:13-999(-)
MIPSLKVLDSFKCEGKSITYNYGGGSKNGTSKIVLKTGSASTSSSNLSMHRTPPPMLGKLYNLEVQSTIIRNSTSNGPNNGGSITGLSRNDAISLSDEDDNFSSSSDDDDIFAEYMRQKEIEEWSRVNLNTRSPSQIESIARLGEDSGDETDLDIDLSKVPTVSQENNANEMVDKQIDVIETTSAGIEEGGEQEDREDVIEEEEEEEEEAKGSTNDDFGDDDDEDESEDDDYNPDSDSDQEDIPIPEDIEVEENGEGEEEAIQASLQQFKESAVPIFSEDLPKENPKDTQQNGQTDEETLKNLKRRAEEEAEGQKDTKAKLVQSESNG